MYLYKVWPNYTIDNVPPKAMVTPYGHFGRELEGWFNTDSQGQVLTHECLASLCAYLVDDLSCIWLYMYMFVYETHYQVDDVMLLS